MNDKLQTTAIFVVGLVATLGIARGCNELWNRREIINESHHTTSYATGLTGHVEYTVFKDGTRDIKEYPGLGHRLFDSELFQELDGDSLIDRIRKNFPEWKMNRLNKILTREFDYKQNKEKFDEADKLLREHMKKYP